VPRKCWDYFGPVTLFLPDPGGEEQRHGSSLDGELFRRAPCQPEPPFVDFFLATTLIGPDYFSPEAFSPRPLLSVRGC